MHFGSNNFEFGWLFVLVGTFFAKKRKEKEKKLKQKLEKKIVGPNLCWAKSGVILILVDMVLVWGGAG